MEKTLNVHTCSHCGWETKAPDHVLLIFHPCQATKSRRRLKRRNPALDERRDAERTEWARRLLGPVATSIEDALGERALLPVDDADLVRGMEEE